MTAWRDLLDQTANQPDAVERRWVNDFFKRRVQFGTDSTFWGKQDYWATPLEVLGRAKGGCEDFAIAVCVTLKLLGILSEKRRMTYVKARIGGAQSIRDQAHRVLSHYPAPGDEPLGLDILNPDSWPASRRSDLTVVFGFNTKGLGGGRSQSPCSQHVATALEMAVGHCQDAGGRSHLKALVLRAMSCH